MLNGWLPYGNVYGDPKYVVDMAGVVHLSGLVKSGEGAIFVLPKGLRPTKRQVFTVSTNPNVYGRVDVDSSGNVIALKYDPGYLSLSVTTQADSC